MAPPFGLEGGERFGRPGIERSQLYVNSHRVHSVPALTHGYQPEVEFQHGSETLQGLESAPVSRVPRPPVRLGGRGWRYDCNSNLCGACVYICMCACDDLRNLACGDASGH